MKRFDRKNNYYWIKTKQKTTRDSKKLINNDEEIINIELTNGQHIDKEKMRMMNEDDELRLYQVY